MTKKQKQKQKQKRRTRLKRQVVQPHRRQPTSLRCPWDFPDKNSGVGCHFLLQGVFLTWGSNPCFLCLLNWQADSLPLSLLGSPFKKIQRIESSKEPEPVLSASDVSKTASCPLSPIADSSSAFASPTFSPSSSQ